MTKKEADQFLLDAKKGRTFLLIIMSLTFLFNILITLMIRGTNNFLSLGVAVAAFILIFAVQFGPNPRRWWRGIWGTEVMLDHGKLTSLSVADRQKRLEDMEAWTLSELPHHDVIKINPWRYQFRRKDQAMLFKMTWS